MELVSLETSEHNQLVDESVQICKDGSVFALESWIPPAGSKIDVIAMPKSELRLSVRSDNLEPRYIQADGDMKHVKWEKPIKGEFAALKPNKMIRVETGKMSKNDISFSNSMAFEQSYEAQSVRLLPKNHVACLTKNYEKTTCSIYSMANKLEVKRYYLEEND